MRTTHRTSPQPTQHGSRIAKQHAVVRLFNPTASSPTRRARARSGCARPWRGTWVLATLARTQDAGRMTALIRRSCSWSRAAASNSRPSSSCWHPQPPPRSNDFKRFASLVTINALRRLQIQTHRSLPESARRPRNSSSPPLALTPLSCAHIAHRPDAFYSG